MPESIVLFAIIKLINFECSMKMRDVTHLEVQHMKWLYLWFSNLRHWCTHAWIHKWEKG